MQQISFFLVKNKAYYLWRENDGKANHDASWQSLNAFQKSGIMCRKHRRNIKI